MEKKKVVYQITRKKYRLVEVETEEQEELIKELNRDFEREDKRQKALRARYLSLEQMTENVGDTVADDSPDAEEIFIEKEHDSETKTLIHNAMQFLTARQREILIKSFWEGKTIREIGEELGLHYTTVSESYHAAIKKLQKILQNTPTNRT